MKSFINKFLITGDKSDVPAGANKLQISTAAFLYLISHFQVPPSFVLAVSQHFLPTGRSSIPTSIDAQTEGLEFWYIMPVRLQVRCNDPRLGHAKSMAGSNQMDPFHYLHLHGVGIDVRGSQIAVFFRCSLEKRSSSLIVINFMDGRWSKPAREPQRRIKETLEASKAGNEQDEYAPHVVLISSALRWWINALTSVHEQLVICVKQNGSVICWR